jgi:high-affinity K+ transport system ATPase subunit B
VMEGKAGVSMESRKKMSRAKSNSPMKRTVRRAVAWLLVFCMCMANMNSAVYAAEIATSSDALMAATPSDAAATDSNAAEILMPEQTVSGEELKEEAIRAISAGHEFDFDSEIRVMKDAEGKNESYSELFKGYRSFTLFADNGNGGRLTGGNDNAYGYIVVRVDKDSYEAFEKEEGTARATGSDAADSSAAERVWSLTGDEELIFLYVNADNGTVTTYA